MSQLPPYKLIRSFRQTLSIQISRDGEIVVKAPVFIPSILIRQFVNGKRDWIEKHVAHVRKTGVKKKQYMEGEEFMYLGTLYKLRIGNFKEISVNGALNFPQFMAFRIEKEMKEWYIREAKRIITERVQHYAAVMKADYWRIVFSDTISKWGSCTAENSLQFNWRLVMAPILVIDYVVVHELAHTWVKNHSRAFWEKVAFYKPAYKQYRKWLHTNSHQLLV